MLLKPTIFQNLPLLTAISTKKDGDMWLSDQKTNWQNRLAFFKKLNLPPEKTFFIYRAHGTKIANINKNKPANNRFAENIFYHYDGLVTTKPGIFMAITVADCLPIFLYEDSLPAIALIHAGWQGVVNNVAASVVLEIKKLGGRPENLTAYIGPSIGSCHFQIGSQVLKLFPAKYRLQKEGKNFVDLKALQKDQLLSAGLISKNIEVSPDCTYCKKSLYFSARRGDQQRMIVIFGHKTVRG